MPIVELSFDGGDTWPIVSDGGEPAIRILAENFRDMPDETVGYMSELLSGRVVEWASGPMTRLPR